MKTQLTFWGLKIPVSKDLVAPVGEKAYCKLLSPLPQLCCQAESLEQLCGVAAYLCEDK